MTRKTNRAVAFIMTAVLAVTMTACVGSAKKEDKPLPEYPNETTSDITSSTVESNQNDSTESSAESLQTESKIEPTYKGGKHLYESFTISITDGDKRGRYSYSIYQEEYNAEYEEVPNDIIEYSEYLGAPFTPLNEQYSGIFADEFGFSGKGYGLPKEGTTKMFIDRDESGKIDSIVFTDFDSSDALALGSMAGNLNLGKDMPVPELATAWKMPSKYKFVEDDKFTFNIYIDDYVAVYFYCKCNEEDSEEEWVVSEAMITTNTETDSKAISYNSTDNDTKEKPTDSNASALKKTVEGDEHLYEYLWVNGQRYSICDFKLDEFESKIGDSMPYVVYDENLKYDGYFSDKGNFTRGYWTNGKGSTKLFLEVNGNDITAAVVTDLASTDTGMISFGDGASVSMIGVRDIELNEDVTDYSFTRKIGKGSWEQTEDGNIRTYVDNYATATVLIDAEGQNEPVKELMVVGN